MNLSAILALLAPVLKPVVTEVLNNVVYPEITKLESQIGNAAVQTLTQNVTAAVENWFTAELANL